MIATLFITIIVEAIIAGGYCFWRGKPLAPILLTSLIANLVTQSLLWIGLNIFFQWYLIALLIAEILIWWIEGFVLYYFAANKLRIREAIFLAFLMNVGSFALGWFLPV